MQVGCSLSIQLLALFKFIGPLFFILPKYVANEIDKLMRGFLWSHGESRKGMAKIKWKDVCSFKVQGGLGIKSLHV